MPILQMGKLNLGEAILARGNIAKNLQSQDLNPGLPTCILPAPSVALTWTLTCLHPKYTHPQPGLGASWLARLSHGLQVGAQGCLVPLLGGAHHPLSPQTKTSGLKHQLWVGVNSYF